MYLGMDADRYIYSTFWLWLPPWPFVFCQGHVSQSVECTQECLTVDTVLLLRAIYILPLWLSLYSGQLESALSVENQAGAECLPNLWMRTGPHGHRQREQTFSLVP